MQPSANTHAPMLSIKSPLGRVGRSLSGSSCRTVHLAIKAGSRGKRLATGPSVKYVHAAETSSPGIPEVIGGVVGRQVPGRAPSGARGRADASVPQGARDDAARPVGPFRAVDRLSVPGGAGHLDHRAGG